MPLPSPGDPMPNWVAPSDINPRFSFSTTAGRWMLLGLIDSSTNPAVATALAPLREPAAQLLDGRHAGLLLISADPGDITPDRVPKGPAGLRAIWDRDSAIARALGVAEEGRHRPAWFLLDPMLRVVQIWPLAETAAMLATLAALPPPGMHAGLEVPAPILVLPRVFEPELCRALIERYRQHGGEASGFMREVDGRTVGAHDPRHKIRRDCLIEDDAMRKAIMARIHRRLVPEIARTFQFHATRLERYLVACYSAEEGGHFAAHRDNTTKGTAHRRFAVTFNLNAEDYEGGDLVFPEFGRRAYRAPTGGAVVFSCSLLHQALPVRRGERFAFLPFLYDDAAAKIREENLKHLDA